jgi:hypothetical protein
MGRVASSVDNTMIESFWSTMQRELLDTQRWASQEQLASAIFEWIEAWSNRDAGTPASATSAPSTSNTFTPPPPKRHDHHTNRVRRTGSGSRSPGENLEPGTPAGGPSLTSST